MLIWRVQPTVLLKEHGYSSYRIRKENLIDQSSMQRLRHSEPVSWSCLDTICRLTGKQPGKLIQYIPDK